MQARVLVFVIWAAVAATAVFWLLRLWSSSPSAPAHTVPVTTNTPTGGDLTRVLGAPAAPAGPSAPVALEPALASRFKLLGVAAPREGGDTVGLALIAVDGKPARGFKVGAVIEGELVLQSVHPRGAALGADGAAPSVSLELPPLPQASGGARPPMPSVMPTVPPPGAPPIFSLPTPPVPPPQPGAQVPNGLTLPDAETVEPVPLPGGPGGRPMVR